MGAEGGTTSGDPIRAGEALDVVDAASGRARSHSTLGPAASRAWNRPAKKSDQWCSTPKWRRTTDPAVRSGAERAHSGARRGVNIVDHQTLSERPGGCHAKHASRRLDHRVVEDRPCL